MRFFSASPFCVAACEVGGLQLYFLSIVCGEAVSEGRVFAH